MKKKIILFPFAGASFYSYRAFEEQCPPSIEIISLEAPGRGKRITEELIDDIHNLADDFYTQIIENTNESDSVYFFGHSLGAVLALLVTQKLADKNKALPKHLVLSGKNPPHFNSQITNRHLLSDIDFKQMISDMGGTPKEILENKDMLDFFLPILRADFSLIDKASFEKPTSKLSATTTILYGKNDKNTDTDKLEEWNLYFEKKTQYKEFQGEHFFIFQYISQIYDIILGKD